jgi:DNA-binding PadR family transcriptional regulator
MASPTSPWAELKLVFRFLWACLIGYGAIIPDPRLVRQSHLSLRVLDLLRERDPMTGYEIVKVLSPPSTPRDTPGWVGYGTLYPVLGSLVESGILRAEKRPAPPGRGPYRVYYRLTTLGHSIFPEQQ